MAIKGELLYVISSGPSGPVKIGITKDIARRLKQIQGSVPEELVLLAAYTMMDVERHFHSILSEYHLRGEWFSSDAADILKDILRPRRRRATKAKS